MPQDYNYELSAEEEKKREKEKALKFFTAAYYYEVLPASKPELRMIGYEAFFDALSQTRNGSDFVEELIGAFLLGIEIRKSREQLSAFFSLDDTLVAEEVKNTMQSLQLEDDSFPVIALCAAGKDMETLAEHIWSSEKTDGIRPEDIEAVRGNSVIHARNALLSYRSGDSRQFAALLAEGLKYSCKGFAAALTPEYACRWSCYTDDILYILKSRPELIRQTGLTKQQLQTAEDVSSMGRDITDGLSAVHILAETRHMKGFKLTDIQNEVLTAKISKMKKSLSGKSAVLDNWDEPEPVRTI